MVGQDVAVRLHKHARHIVERRRCQLDRASRSETVIFISQSTQNSAFRQDSQDFVNNLAVVVRCRCLARIGLGARLWVHTVLDETNPRVLEARIRELIDTASRVGPTVVGVAAKNDRAALGVGVNGIQKLVDAGGASINVPVVRTKL